MDLYYKKYGYNYAKHSHNAKNLDRIKMIKYKK